MPIDENIIKSHLAHSQGRVRFLIYDEVTSTNTLCKEKARSGENEGLTVIADSQNGGYGRYGRIFYSPGETGLYMSILLRPEMPISDALLITTAAAVSVSEAIECLTEQKCQIKWVNDVLINGKKVCGILTESGIEDGRMSYAVLGIGINVSKPTGDFPESISSVAGAVIERSEYGFREKLAAEIIDRFFSYYDVLSENKHYDGYLKRLCSIGKNVTAVSGDKGFDCEVIGLDRDFSLIVKNGNGNIEKLSSGEVSIKIK